MTIKLSNSSLKLRKSGIFGPKFKDFYFFTKLWNKANSRAPTANMTMVFHETLQLDKLEGVDYKYDNRFSTFYPKDTNRLFWSHVYFFVLDQSS